MSSPKGNILIVDDDESLGRFVEVCFRQEGYQPLYLSSPLRALEVIAEQKFDLVITDLKMAEMDGLKFLQAIKADHIHLPAIVVTGHGGFREAVQSLHVGVQTFIVKPFSSEELHRAAEHVLEQAKLFRENERLRCMLPLYDAGRELFLEKNLPSLYEKSVRLAIEITQSDAAVLMSGQSEGMSLLASAGTPIPLQKMEETALAIAQMTQTRSVPLTDQDPNVDADLLLRETPAGVFLSVPVFYEERCLAILVLFRRDRDDPYQKEGMDRAHIVAGQIALAMENATLVSDMEAAHFKTVEALLQSIDAKPGETQAHCSRVVQSAMNVANRMGLSSNERKYLSYAAVLHDIGIFGISDEILKKEGKLTELEYRQVKTHPSVGADVIRDLEFLKPVIPLIYHHQERYDGSGYPDGLCGEAIPVGARILAVADTFDALTSARPYRPALSHEAALDELRRCSGTQLDPQVVDHFISGLQIPA
jgi:response regulator RpfG family c-di-GMP phosphodiesterase